MVSFNKLLPTVFPLFLIILFAPFVLCIILFFRVWKTIIVFLSNYLDKKLLYAVDSSDLLFVSDDFFTKPHSNIVSILILNGVPDLDRVKNDFRAMYNRIGDDGQRMYWKLACHPVKWCGYWFWKRIENFDMENQVEVLDDTVYTSDDDLPLLVQRLIRKRYKESCGLWGITIVPNFKRDPNKTIIVFRFSHLIFDGISWLKFYYQLGGAKSSSRDIPTIPAKEITFLDQINTWTKLPSAMLEYFNVYKSLPDKNCIVDMGKTKPSGNWICALSPKLPLNKVKQARKVFNAQFFDITMAAVMGGTRKYILKHYGENSIPEIMHSTFPMPKVNHPNNTLVNHWSIVAVPFPVNIDNIPERVKKIRELTRLVQTNAISNVVDAALMFANTLPIASFYDSTSEFVGFTMLNSGIAGPPKVPPLFGVPVSEMMYWASNNRENTQGVSFGWFSSNGSIRFTLTADKAFIKRRELLNELALHIHYEFSCIFEEAARILGQNCELPTIYNN